MILHNRVCLPTLKFFILISSVMKNGGPGAIPLFFCENRSFRSEITLFYCKYRIISMPETPCFNVKRVQNIKQFPIMLLYFNTRLYSMFYWFSLLQCYLLQLHLYTTLLYSYSLEKWVVFNSQNYDGCHSNGLQLKHSIHMVRYAENNWLM